ncbi:MAG: hypothetical protein ACRD0H_02470, partial [Actinomycetes bacterium]
GYVYYRYSRAVFWRLALYSPAALTLLTSGGESGGQARWRNHSHPRYVRIVQNWTGRPLEGLSDQELLDGVIELLDAGTEYYTAAQTIIPIAAPSEVIFTQFYERLVHRAGDPPAATFLLGFDSVPILAEKSGPAFVKAVLPAATGGPCRPAGLRGTRRRTGNTPRRDLAGQWRPGT